MRCVGMVRAACVSAALLACAFGVARADPASGDLSDGPAPPDLLSGGTGIEKFLYFSGFDLWRGGGSFYGGLQWAPGGLNGDGFTLKLLFAEGTYRYLSGATTIRGTGLLAAILPGWRIKRGDVEIKLFAGLDLQNHRTSPDDPASSLRGNHVGIRVNTEVWWEPTASLMLASSLSASTIGNSFGVRGAAGWRVLDRFWIGPEISKPRATASIASIAPACTSHRSGWRRSSGRWAPAMSRTTATAPASMAGSACWRAGSAPPQPVRRHARAWGIARMARMADLNSFVIMHLHEKGRAGAVLI